MAEIDHHLEAAPSDAGLLFRKAELLLQTGHPSASFSMLRADIFEAATACDLAIALVGMHPRGGKAGDDVALRIEKLTERKAGHLKRSSSSNQPTNLTRNGLRIFEKITL